MNLKCIGVADEGLITKRRDEILNLLFVCLYLIIFQHIISVFVYLHVITHKMNLNKEPKNDILNVRKKYV